MLPPFFLRSLSCVFVFADANPPYGVLFCFFTCVIMIWVMKMNEENKLSKRKHPRLDNYDYSSKGAYFVTICVQNRRCVLSRIVRSGKTDIQQNVATNPIEYTTYGRIAEKQLLMLEERYPHLSIDKYVIMPNHVHVILVLDGETAGARLANALCNGNLIGEPLRVLRAQNS